MAADFDSETAQLVERFCGGDEAAAGEVLGVFGPPLRAFLRRAFGGPISGEVDQIALDAVEEARECGARFEPSRGSFFAWLSGIARHRAIDWLRAATADGELFQIATDPDRLARVIDLRAGAFAQDAHVGGGDVSECVRLVRRALEALSDVQRQVMMADACSPVGPIPSRQLAQEFGVADSTVRSARQRGKQALRALLLELGIEAFILCDTPRRIY